MVKRKDIWKGIRLILFNEIAIMTAFAKLSEMPLDVVAELNRLSEATADFLDEKPQGI